METSTASRQSGSSPELESGVANPARSPSTYRNGSRPEVVALLPNAREGLKVLEIGCGDGAFGASITSFGEIWGIEPFGESAKLAAARLHVVLDCTYEAAKSRLPLGFFDVVVCNDVIEHMVDHDAFLRSIQDHMKPGGALVGSIPNVRYYKNLFDVLVLRDWEYQNSGILDRTHFRFFTFRSLRRSLERAGFVVEQMRGLNGGIFFAWNRWALAYYAFAHSLILITGGRARDVVHLQIGFRAVLKTGQP